MTELVDALLALGLPSEISLAGRWARLEGGHCAIFVVAASRGGYYTWCDDPAARSIQFHRTAHEAIQAGRDRAAHGAQRAREREANSAEPD